VGATAESKQIVDSFLAQEPQTQINSQLQDKPLKVFRETENPDLIGSHVPGTAVPNTRIDTVISNSYKSEAISRVSLSFRTGVPTVKRKNLSSCFCAERNK
jgi:hypothetical protein